MPDQVQSRNTIRAWVVRFWVPTVVQFQTWMFSFWHKQDMIPMEKIDGLAEALDSKANTSTDSDLVPIILAAGANYYDAPAGITIGKFRMYDNANPIVGIGLSNATNELFDAQQLVNGFAAFTGEYDFKNITRIYFNGVTPTTITKIYK